jgi:hypothetical protein
MSWQNDRSIAAEFSTDGELMVSMSDLVGWLRDCAAAWETIHPCHARAAEAIANSLTDHWLDTTANLLDGSGS